MPIFTFLIINGFFKKKNLKRYLIRLTKVACSTQIAIWILAYINIRYIPQYETNMYEILNIVFSFVLSLIFINSTNNIIIKKSTNLINIVKDISVIITIPLIYTIFCINNIISLDYGFMILILSTLFYLTFKIKEKSQTLYYIILSLSYIIYTIISVILNPIYITLLLALPLLLVYDDKIISKNLKLQKLFYSVFIIQHTLLYLSALIYTLAR